MSARFCEMVEEKFKVLTFNCWFVPFSCIYFKGCVFSFFHRKKRRQTECYCIWLDADYDKLQSLLSEKYPYSNYFHCNLIGTGMCIFCKWPIECVFTHPFTANGYPHLIHQADYYCGKGIGLARITTRGGFRINLYVTHVSFCLPFSFVHYYGTGLKNYSPCLIFVILLNSDMWLLTDLY
ncbi:unnamed protein product [Trichobilharzia regenti]|nr:unnamed protein product [Trichobilharzia regenti]